MYKELKLQISYFVKNRIYLISLLLTTIAGYAYQLTHGTCGVDDVSIDLYFEKGLGVAIGRWPFYLINKVIPIADEYHPFIGDFITVLLLMVAAVVWCALIRMVLKAEVPIWCYVVFSAMFMNYSLIAEVFVFYLQNGLGFVYLLTGIALFGTYYIFTNAVEIKESIGIRVTVIASLIVAISFYESAANLYLSGAILIIYIGMLSRREECNFDFKKLFGCMIFVVRYLVYAMIARRVVRTIIMRVFGIMPYTFYRSASLSWLFKGGAGKIWENIGVVLEEIAENYFVAGKSYVPITLFVLATLVFFAHLFVDCIKGKRILQGIVGLGFYISMFVLSLVQGGAVTYRACQIFSVFVGIVLFGITKLALEQKGWLKIATSAVVTLCILVSIYDLNKWFELDYRKTEYEMSILQEIGEELQNGTYDIEHKPVVIVGDFELDESLVKEYGYSQNRVSILNWSVKAFAMHYGYNIPIRQLFERLGYSFNWASQELCEEVFATYYPLDKELYDIDPLLETYTELYDSTEQYPNAGYIEETETYIVIKL